jgi:DMSO reductase anchor subunit
MNMRRRFFVAALVLVFAVGLFGVAAAQVKKTAGKAPRIVVESKAMLLGDVLEGQDLQYTFVVKNTGDAELQILNVRPG